MKSTPEPDFSKLAAARAGAEGLFRGIDREQAALLKAEQGALGAAGSVRSTKAQLPDAESRSATAAQAVEGLRLMRQKYDISRNGEVVPNPLIVRQSLTDRHAASVEAARTAAGAAQGAVATAIAQAALIAARRAQNGHQGALGFFDDQIEDAKQVAELWRVAVAEGIPGDIAAAETAHEVALAAVAKQRARLDRARAAAAVASEQIERLEVELLEPAISGDAV